MTEEIDLLEYILKETKSGRMQIERSLYVPGIFNDRFEIVLTRPNELKPLVLEEILS